MVVLIIVGAIAFIVIDALISGQFMNIAASKGDDSWKYFWFCFLFGVVGYLMVIALPDMKARSVQPKTEPLTQLRK